MFSFFRKSKRDAAENASNNNASRDRKSKEKDVKRSPSSSSRQQHDQREDEQQQQQQRCDRTVQQPCDDDRKKDAMCKNKLPIEKLLFANAPSVRNGDDRSPKVVAEFGKNSNSQQDAAAAIACGALVKPDDINRQPETIASTADSEEDDDEDDDEDDEAAENCKTMDTKRVAENVADGSVARRYGLPIVSHDTNANNNNRTARNVKPCGHGTVAIQPRIPLLTARRDSNSSTPPESPQSEIRNPYRRASKTSAEATDDDGLVIDKSKAIGSDARKDSNEDVKKNLINQEAKFQGQLNELSKQLSSRDAEANKLRFQMEELQRDVFAKSAGMDRLQAELQTAHKESEYVRTKLRHLEEDLDCFRRKNTELSEEIRNKNDNFNQLETVSNAKIFELESTIKDLRAKIESLEQQVEVLKLEKEKLEKDHAELLSKSNDDKKLMEEVLEKASKEKLIVDRKWQDEFEKMRTVSMSKEEQMMNDFEWKLREVEKACKKRIEDKEKTANEKLRESCNEAETKVKEAEELMTQIENLKVYQVEAEQLRGITKEQAAAIQLMQDQQEQMKQVEDGLKAESKKLRRLVDMEKENLQHMQLVHNREIQDRERKLQATLDQKRTEIAMYWEERLLHEIGRLKRELEQLYLEEKCQAIKDVKQEKEDEFLQAKKSWDRKIEECLREIQSLKRTLQEKERHYQKEMVNLQTKTDLDVLELRRIMDKIDMSHHDRFENLVKRHEEEIERLNEESESKLKEAETAYQNQLGSLRATLDLVREQMETESQQKIEQLIAQHRAELDTQWDALLNQKSEAIKLVEDEYVSKYKTLEDQFYTQQKSHEAREIELLKTIDCLKNEIGSKDSTIDDLQSNLDTMDGGIQVLNQEIAQQNEQLLRIRRESDSKIENLQEQVATLQSQLEKERAAMDGRVNEATKESQTAIDHLQRKCQCLTKLFEEVRARYERRDSREEDLNTIADLRRVIAEQEKDLTCLNEEKRYIQMRLMNLERSFDDDDNDQFEDSQDFDAQKPNVDVCMPPAHLTNGFVNQQQQAFNHSMNTSSPPMATIPECDDCDEC